MAYPNCNDLRMKSVPGNVLIVGRGGELLFGSKLWFIWKHTYSSHYRTVENDRHIS